MVENTRWGKKNLSPRVDLRAREEEEKKILRYGKTIHTPLLAYLTIFLLGGLKNDNEYETFTLKHTIDGNLFPCRFILWLVLC